MKHKFPFQVVGAVAVVVAMLMTGCETVNALTELGTSVAVATGSITTNEASSIKIGRAHV